MKLNARNIMKLPITILDRANMFIELQEDHNMKSQLKYYAYIGPTIRISNTSKRTHFHHRTNDCHVQRLGHLTKNVGVTFTIVSYLAINTLTKDMSEKEQLCSLILL